MPTLTKRFGNGHWMPFLLRASVAVLLLTNIPSANAAPILYFDSLKSTTGGCITKYDSPYMQSGRLIARRDIRITAINVAIGTAVRTSFNSTTYNIFTNDTSTNAPGVLLATYSPSSISGANSLSVARYVGDYSISSGTNFWVVPGQLPTVLSQCYFTASSPVELGMNGVTADSSTSNSDVSYWRAYSASSSPVGATWAGIQNFGLIVQLSLESSVPAPVGATIATQSGSLAANYRTVTPLAVNVDTTSKVTFYANGKVIAGCRNILSSSGTATCNWKPSVHGSYRIYAAANPVSNSYVAANTPTISVGVVARTNKR